VSPVSRPGGADLVVLAAVLMWGANFSFTKYALASIDALSFSLLRHLCASVVLLALAAMTTGLRVARRDLLSLAGLGVLGVTLYQSMWTFGLAHTTAAKSSILVATTPIFGALMAPLFGQRAPRVMAWAGIIGAFSGVYLIVNDGFAPRRLDGGGVLGDAVTLAGAVVWAVYNTWSGPLLLRVGAVKALTWSTLFGTLAFLPVAGWGALRAPWSAQDSHFWLAFGFSFLLSPVVGALLWYRGMQLLGVGRTLVYAYLIPVVAIGTASLLLGERLSLPQAVGVVVVLIGVAVARRG